jgi:hypothetical protein
MSEIVIGIGLPKTGTKSLAKALTILGYNCAHHPVAYHKQVIYQGDYTLPEGHNAFTNTAEDFYPELATMYPDAKFVLTTRSMQNWLGSWKRKDKPKAEQSDIGFADRVRIFGTCRYNSHRFRKVYRTHIASALDCFHTSMARPAFSKIAAGISYQTGRLLIMPMEGNWDALCGFLEKPIPDRPYPHVTKGAAL